jgi:NADP-dependent 3-hydroxy acid dehydrogenase YdfG
MTPTNYHRMVYYTNAFFDSMLVRKSGHIVNTAIYGATNRREGVFLSRMHVR